MVGFKTKEKIFAIHLNYVEEANEKEKKWEEREMSYLMIKWKKNVLHEFVLEERKRKRTRDILREIFKFEHLKKSTF